MKKKIDIYEYLDFRSYLADYLKFSPRGMQAKIARAVPCQATHIINVTKGKSQLTEDQAFRIGRYLQLSESQLTFFLDLVRMDRAVEAETKSYYRRKLQTQAMTSKDVKSRVAGVAMAASLEDQLQYFCSPEIPLIHLATSCGHLQTIDALAKKFNLEVNQVTNVINFLLQKKLVEKKNERYIYTGLSLHLSKDSPLHPIFQKTRREIVLENLKKKTSDEGVQFSSAFATTQQHLGKLRAKLLDFIEETHHELLSTPSEEIAILVVDLCTFEK